MKKLERNLKASLSKSDKFFNWNDYWQLEEKRIQIKDKDIKSIAKIFQDTQESTATTDIVNKFFGADQEDRRSCRGLHSPLSWITVKKYRVGDEAAAAVTPDIDTIIAFLAIR